jgi:hypothetical protein
MTGWWANPSEKSLSGRIAADGKDPVIFSHQAPWSMRAIWSQKAELLAGSSASVKFFQDSQK